MSGLFSVSVDSLLKDDSQEMREALAAGSRKMNRLGAVMAAFGLACAAWVVVGIALDWDTALIAVPAAALFAPAMCAAFLVDKMRHDNQLFAYQSVLAFLAGEERQDRLVGEQLVVVAHLVDEEGRAHGGGEQRGGGDRDERRVPIQRDPDDHPCRAGEAERRHDGAESVHLPGPRGERLSHLLRVILEQRVDADAEQAAHEQQALRVGVGAARLPVGDSPLIDFAKSPLEPAGQRWCR